MSSSTREKVHHNELVVGRTYRVVNEWYSHNYMNDCMEIYNGDYIRKFQINNNITVVFLVNGREKYVNSVNNFYLVQDNHT